MKKESKASIITMIILMALIALCVLISCRAPKYTQSEQRSSETLALRHERLTASLLSDWLIKSLSIQADSIILEYQDDWPYRDIQDKESEPPEDTLLPRNRFQRVPGSRESSGFNSRPSGKSALSSCSGKPKTPPLKSLKLYAPRIAENSEAGSVDITSSSDSSAIAEQSEAEEESVRYTAPSPTQKYIFLLLAAAVAWIIYRHSR